MTSNDAPSAKRILILTPQFPYPAHQGTTLRNLNLIAGLAPRHQVHLLSFGEPAQCQGTPLDDLCDSVRIVRPPQRSTGQRLRGLVTSRLPDMAQRLPSTEFRDALSTIWQREDPDVIEVEGIELAQYLFQVADSRPPGQRPLLVFDEHNAEYVLQQRAFETDVRQPGRWVAAAYSVVQWQRLRRYERRACLAADCVVAVSDTDAEALRRLVPGLDPIVVPNGVDTELYATQLPALLDEKQPSSRDLVFTAKMDFRPNIDAVLWFAEKVLPAIRKEMPDVRFWVVGKDPHPRLATLADDPGVVITGWVDDVRPYIAAAAVYVIPLRIGGGTRLKVLEAMAMSKAIVSTTLGCEGFDLESGRELLMADTPSEFAAAVLNLLRDPDHGQKLGATARRFARENYDWQSIVPLLEQVYQD